MEPNHTARDAAIARLDAFIGAWVMEARRRPRLCDGPQRRVWTLLRDSADFTPLDFAQRYTGTFGADGQRIDGRLESAQDGATWELDFQLNDTRVS